MPTIGDAKRLGAFIPHVYGDTATSPAGWSVAQSYDHQPSGFKANVYVDGTGTRLVIAVAGLDVSGNSRTLNTSLQILDGNRGTEYDAYLLQLLGLLDDGLATYRNGGAHIDIVGHSLGGWAAQMATAYLFEQQYYDVSTVTFGTLGAAESFQASQFRYDSSLLNPFILNIVDVQDPVSTFKPHIGVTVKIGEESWAWKFLDVFTSVFFPLRPLYLLGATEAFHASTHYLKWLDSVAPSADLPPLTFDPSVGIPGSNPQNVQDLRDALGALPNERVTDLLSGVEVVPNPGGEAYALVFEHDDRPTTVIAVPSSSGNQGMIVGVGTEAEAVFAAAPGTVEKIVGVDGGAVELHVNAAVEGGLDVVHVEPDGSGWLSGSVYARQQFGPEGFVQLGTGAGERLDGSQRPDVIVAAGGNDTVTAAAGNDLVYAGAGDDAVTGGEGDDSIYGGAGNDRLEGGEGDDFLLGGDGNDVLYGGDGDDFLGPGDGEDWLFGGPGDDGYLAAVHGLTHVRDDGWVTDVCSDFCGDRLQFESGISPSEVQVFWKGRDIIFRIGGGSGTVWVEDGLADWDDDDDDHEIELVEFADGTVWPWVEVLKRAEPLPPEDPMGESGPPPEIGPPILRDLQRGRKPTIVPVLDDIISVFDDARAIISPIVVDLDGDGVETRHVDAGAHFDHDGDGFAERTGWVGADDGLLVWDRNGDGIITDGSELFGNRTLLPDGITPAANGFAALAAWDDNADGKIDANDAVWANLRIWRDTDSDGVSTPAEFAGTPVDLGVTALSTVYTTSDTVDAQGNQHRQAGSFTRADGTTGAAADVWFKTDPVHAVAPDPVPVPADVAALPTLRGYGTLYSLRQAMARDGSGTLKALVAAFVAEVDPAQRESLGEQILLRWTGADGVDPASRGLLMDARQLQVVEAFMGQGYLGSDGQQNPHHTSAPLLKEAYARLKEWVYAQLDIQTHLADLYRMIPFSWDPQRGLVGDPAPVMVEIQNRLAVNPVAGQRDLSEFARSIRALKTEDMLGFWAFRDTLVAQDPALGWFIDSGGRNVIVGTAGSEGLTGTLRPDAMRGGDGDDTLWGQGGEDALYGEAGRDVIYGGPGDDVLVGGADGDQLYGEAGRNRLEGGDGGDWMIGGDEADLLIGGAGNDYLYANGGDDRLLGGAGNDSLSGGAGADDLEGGGGNDYLDGGPGADTYHFGRGSGVVTIGDSDPTPGVVDVIQMGPGVLPGDVRVWRNGDHLNLQITATGDLLGVLNYFSEASSASQIEELRFVDGTVWDVAAIRQMVLTGTDGPETLIGFATDDTLRGLGGSDWIYGRAGNDTLDGGPGNDYMWGEAGNDTLLGGAGNDQLYAGDGADTIDGGGGVDYAEGGPGGDTYLFGRGSGTLTIRDLDATTGAIDTIQLGPGVLPTDVTMWRNGDHLNLRINDTGETLGVLYFFWQDTPDNQIEQIRFGNGTIWDVVTIKQMVLTGTSGADQLIGYGTADTLQGLGGNDTLWGRAGDDRLDGGSGADAMYGEAGNDTYVVDDAADQVIESAGNGVDTVESSVTYALPAEAENLTLTGSNAVNATGNGLGNTLAGNPAANVLDGRAGADTMAGGAGNDTYVIDNAGDIVLESAGAGIDTVQSSITYTLPANVENLMLTGAAAINGTGNALNNVLTGNAAANVLNGGAGADTMSGGAGDDTYVVDSTGDTVVEAAGEGTDTIQSSVTSTLPANVENLVLTGAAAINGTGNGLNNRLTGNSAANVLNGSAGADVMAGGAGNDTYVVDNPSDVVIEGAGQGSDTIQSSVTSTLPANVENLTLTSIAAINGTGNALNNILRGNSAANVLAGGPGNDTYVVGAGDTVVENPGEGVDTVQSSVSWTLAANVESLTLTGTAVINGTGNALNNSLTGNTAANVLDGGPGNDTLIGRRGNDTYVFNAGWGQDTISENDSTSGSTDTVLFGAAVRPLDLVLSRAANNLAVTLHGGTDRATVQNWYSGSAYQTEVIVASDGSRLLSSQVDLLIQAMANFSAGAGLTWDQAIEQRPDEVQAILASYWQPPSY